MLKDNIANWNLFVSITFGNLMKGQKIGALMIKKVIKAKKLEPLTSQCRFKQLINDLTDILQSSS